MFTLNPLRGAATFGGAPPMPALDDFVIVEGPDWEAISSYHTDSDLGSGSWSERLSPDDQEELHQNRSNMGARTPPKEIAPFPREQKAVHPLDLAGSESAFVYLSNPEESPPDQSETRATTPLELGLAPKAIYPAIALDPLTKKQGAVHMPLILTLSTTKQDAIQMPIEEGSPFSQNGIDPMYSTSPHVSGRRARRLLRAVNDSSHELNKLSPAALDFLFSIPLRIGSFFLAHKEAFLLGTKLLIRAAIVVLVAMTVKLPVASLDNLAKSALSIELLLAWRHQNIAANHTPDSHEVQPGKSVALE